MKNFIMLLVLALFLTHNTYAWDISGSSDHPMVSRYDGSSIVNHDFREFDEYEILLGKVKHDPENSSEKIAESSEAREGKVTRMSYYLPEDR